MKGEVTLSNNEQFEIVDKEGRVIGMASREECHRSPGLLHRTVHVFIKNTWQNYLLQLRGLEKDIQPGKWDTSVGGHFMPGETPEEAAERELSEELSINGLPLSFLYSYIWRSDRESELVYTFIAEYDGQYSCQAEELQEAKFWSVEKIEENIGKNVFTPNFEHEWERLKKILK